jgi:hypothetical protein
MKANSEQVMAGSTLTGILLLAALAVLALAACGGAAAPTAGPTPAPAINAVPASAAQVEERYGVQVTLVAWTAEGGLIDLRLRVTDPAKAAFLLKAETMPLLIVEKNGTVLRVPGALDQDQLLQGQVYYLLYPNAQSALSPGDPVSLVIGDLRLEHLTIQ